MSTESDIKALGEALHQRLTDGDDFAISELCDRLLPSVTAKLLGQNRDVDEHLIHSAINDAFLNYINNPSSYDPSLSSLASYLRMSAQRDLQNHLKTLHRRQKVVELSLDDAEHEMSDEGKRNIEQQFIDSESPLVRKVFEIVTDDIDRQIVSLMMDKVRDTKEFADILNISYLPEKEQRDEVKRHKDRIKASVKRKLRLKAGR